MSLSKAPASDASVNSIKLWAPEKDTARVQQASWRNCPISRRSLYLPADTERKRPMGLALSFRLQGFSLLADDLA